ncbi:GtrA family protein [Olivibacter ginsenosidimutans]|uniref:GtrA family protein n=1 Tax=Olivibacter ginsenosidimutans TaxID=1176537 RepID=UPI0031EA0A7E
MLAKFIKFGLVGFLGLILDFSITYLLKEKLRCNGLLANALGFAIALGSNYLLNRSWTFHSTDPRVFDQLSLFAAVSIAGLLLNTGILYICHNQAKQGFYTSKLCAIVIVCCWNFFANNFITFS